MRVIVGLHGNMKIGVLFLDKISDNIFKVITNVVCFSISVVSCVPLAKVIWVIKRRWQHCGGSILAQTGKKSFKIFQYDVMCNMSS